VPDPIAPPGDSNPPATPPAPPPAQQPPNPPAPPAPTAPPVAGSAVTLTGADLERWRTEQAELARYRQQQTEADAARRATEIQEAARRGNWEQVAQLREADLRAAQQRATEAESRAQTFALDSQLATAISGYSFTDPAWAGILVQQFRGQFQVFPVGQTFHVRHQDGRSVADFLAAEMQKPMYAGVLSNGGITGGANVGDVTGRGAAGLNALPNTPAAREFRDWSIRQQEVSRAGGGMFGLDGIPRG
jgi:hypothetical protein